MATGRLKLVGLDPSIRPAAEWTLAVADYYGVPVDVISGFRSIEAQRVLRQKYESCVAAGRFPSAPDCKYGANRPGESAHNFGLAFDSVVPDRLMPWWAMVRRHAGFHVIDADPPHAEYPGWRGFV